MPSAPVRGGPQSTNDLDAGAGVAEPARALVTLGMIDGMVRPISKISVGEFSESDATERLRASIEQNNRLTIEQTEEMIRLSGVLGLLTWVLVVIAIIVPLAIALFD